MGKQPAPPATPASIFLLASALAASASCSHSEGAEAGPRPSASGVTVASASTAGVEPASAASSSPDDGSCRGKPAGAHACIDRRLVRCKGDGDAEDVRTCFDIERCDASRGACEPACSSGEVYVPPTGEAGFVMGRGMSVFGFGPRKNADKQPGHGEADAPHRVVLTRPFCMDANEVTAGEFLRCVKELGCPEPSILDRWATYPRKPDYPVNMTSWTKAKAYCDKNGKSLPSEAQWEWAATGADHRKWPWGDDPPNCERADFTAETLVSPGGDSGCHGGGPSPVGTHTAGDKEWPAGKIHDLAGNVWEWCLDNYEPYGTSPETDPIHMRSEGGNHVVRGGGWNRSHRGIMTAFRGAAIVTYQVPGLGFRCVRNPKGLRTE